MKDKKKLFETILNPLCSENILIEASKDNENYFSSRVRKAVALHKNTPKEIIDKLLMDEYRWVREAAASNSKIKIKEIDNLFEKFINTKDTEVCDRYVLKGLSLNPNIDLNKRKRINKILRSGKHIYKNKFPVEYDHYEIFSEKCTIDENFLDIFSLNNFLDIASDGDRLDLDLVEEWIFDSEGDILKGEKIINNSKTIIKNIDGNKIKIPIQGNSFEDEMNSFLKSDVENGSILVEGNRSWWGDSQSYSIQLEYELKVELINAHMENGLVHSYTYDSDEFIPDGMYNLENGETKINVWIIWNGNKHVLDIDQLTNDMEGEGKSSISLQDLQHYFKAVSKKNNW